MKRFFKRVRVNFEYMVRTRAGMEMVQVAILVLIAIAVGILFKNQIIDFVNTVFSQLNGDKVAGFADPTTKA